MSEIASGNKVLMRRIYEEMWNKANPALAAELFAKPEGVERFVSQFLSSFADLRHTVEEMIGEDDRVAIRFLANGTDTGQWMHFAPTNKSIRYAGITLARIAGNKIVAHETLWDKAGLMEQIGGK